jgi:predicted ArsR family transcriptional regulator
LVRIGRRGERRPGVPDAERKSGRAPSQIGDHNLRVTLEAIRRDGPLTRLELGSRSGLIGPGITNILRRLGDDGLMTARKRVEGGSGQPSTEFAINADGAYRVGVRLRGDTADAVLIDLSGKVREGCGANIGT